MKPTGRDQPSFPWALFAACASMALAMRLSRLGFQALFLDEYSTWRIASAPGIAAMLRQIHAHEASPPLHFLLTKAWIAIAGDSPFALRLPSALCGVAAVWAAMRTAWEAWPRRRPPVAVAGILAALSTYSLYYSQEARPYALLMLETALIVMLLARLAPGMRAPRESDLWALGAVALLAALTHYFALFALFFALGSLVFRILRTPQSQPRRGLFVCAAWVACLVASLGLAAIAAGSKSNIDWLPPWQWSMLFSYGRALVEGPLLRVAPTWWVGGAIACGMAALAVGAWGRKNDEWPLAFVAILGLLATAALPHAVAAFKPLVFHGQRYLIISLPAWWFAFAWASARANRRRSIAFSVLIALAIAPRVAYLKTYYTQRHKRAWDQVAQFCRESLPPGAPVFYLAPYGDGPLSYHLRNSGLVVHARASMSQMPPLPHDAPGLAIAAALPVVARLPAPQGFIRADARVYHPDNRRATASVTVFRRAASQAAETRP